jgi:hypothetical protein
MPALRTSHRLNTFGVSAKRQNTVTCYRNIYLVLLTLLELKHRETMKKLQNGIVELLIKGTQTRSSGSGQCASRKALSSLKCGSFYPLCRGPTMQGRFVTQRSRK